MFDFLEEPLDQVALAVQCIITGNLGRGFPRRDNRDGVLVCDRLPEGFRIIAFVGKDVRRGKIGDQSFGLANITGLPWCQNEAERITQGIDDGMDLGGQAAS